MPFGLNNGPAVFQTLVNDLLKCVDFVYLNGILIFCKTWGRSMSAISSLFFSTSLKTPSLSKPRNEFHAPSSLYVIHNKSSSTKLMWCLQLGSCSDFIKEYVFSNKFGCLLGPYLLIYYFQAISTLVFQENATMLCVCVNQETSPDFLSATWVTALSLLDELFPEHTVHLMQMHL